eukprot:Nk52_evm2s366 gene=Nk52_evmTU2s366
MGIMVSLERRLPRAIRNNHWFHSSYVVDWIICFLGIGGTYAISLNVAPFCRYDSFSDNHFDPMIGFPLKDDTVPPWTLFFMCMVIPIGIIILCERGSHSWHAVHCGALAVLISNTICVVFTEFGKILAGRYRPDFLARCTAKGIKPHEYDLQKLCDITANDPMLRNGRLSFPSGHTSFAFCGGVFIALYLCGRFRLASSGLGHMYLVLCALIPIFLAFLVAISRTRDYRHNFSDVLAGMLIGVMASVFGYFLHYPGLGDVDCGIPRNRIEALDNHYNSRDVSLHRVGSGGVSSGSMGPAVSSSMRVPNSGDDSSDSVNLLGLPGQSV